MRRLLLKVALLALPFALVAAAVAWIDPFAYFPWNATRVDPVKQDIAYRMMPSLAKLAAYRSHPSPNVLLGDSRMAALDTGEIERLSHARFANLGFGGGSLNEAIRTFWFADRLVKLESATFGVNLDLYNGSDAKDRVTAAEKILENPALYVFDRNVMRAALYDLQSARSGKAPSIGVPPMDKEHFWRFQLDVTARIAFENYRYPEEYRRGLEAIAAHCREKHIRLRFVVFPEHQDLAAVAARYRLEHGEERMVADLSKLGETVDLRRAVNTSDRAQYIDPYHFGPAIAEWIVRRLWGGALEPPPPAAQAATP